ncbi:MAG TPA: hypothetical protein VN947_36230 [Polyangia bacterium]|nr:hypothetical protein [Polyangia bacterium]
MLPLVLVAAIVTQDATPLRAAAKETAARQTLLYAGDWLELRGERQGWLQVYDHRHERPGYVRPSQVRAFPVEEKSAGELAAVIDFVRDQPGAESLGIGLTALFMRAAPANAVGAEVFDALGGMAERLGRRASSKWARPNDATLAGQIEVAESYGVKFRSFEKDGRTRVCYDGEAYRRVLALPASAAAKARAALGLTDPACVDPATGVSDRETIVAWQADVLGKVDAAALPSWLGNRVRIRAAAVRAEVVYAHARKGDWAGARAGEAEAEKALAAVDKPELADEDMLGYDEAALRVAAVRWAADPSTAGKAVEIGKGKPGETCVRFAKAEHCTYAVVWPSSVRVSPRGDAVAFAQSPLPSWTELVVLRRGQEAETMAPAAVDPDVGYVELAGWSPDGARLCVAKEAKMTGPLGQPGTLAPWVQRSFQIVKADGLLVEKQAARLDNFVSFRRWASAAWQRGTLALR